MKNHINKLTKQLLPLTHEIVNHSLYADILSIERLKLFMQEHVFAVWDFMCLLKELHRGIVSTSAPWFPPKDALSANVINSILVEEEGDITEEGHYASHFDIYLSAMDKMGANTQPIKTLLTILKEGKTLYEALEGVPILAGTRDFVLTTFSFFDRPVHEMAAAFVYGREGITSPMFASILQWPELTQDKKYSTLVYYFKRHVTLDSSEHFPKALKMLSNFIGNDNKKFKEAELAAQKALTARLNFLTHIHSHLLKIPL